MNPLAVDSAIEYLRVSLFWSFSLVFGFIAVCFVIWLIYSFFDFIFRFFKKKNGVNK